MLAQTGRGLSVRPADRRRRRRAHRRRRQRARSTPTCSFMTPEARTRQVPSRPLTSRLAAASARPWRTAMAPSSVSPPPALTAALPTAHNPHTSTLFLRPPDNVLPCGSIILISPCPRVCPPLSCRRQHLDYPTPRADCRRWNVVLCQNGQASAGQSDGASGCGPRRLRQDQVSAGAATATATATATAATAKAVSGVGAGGPPRGAGTGGSARAERLGNVL